MNLFEYSKAQLHLKAGSRFMVPPEPKAACDLLWRDPLLSSASPRILAKKFKSPENTIRPRYAWPNIFVYNVYVMTVINSKGIR